MARHQKPFSSCCGEWETRPIGLTRSANAARSWMALDEPATISDAALATAAGVWRNVDRSEAS